MTTKGKAGHREQIGGLAAVVRATFADLEGHGRAPSPDAIAALELVEQWIADGLIDSDTLQAAAHRSHQEGVKFVDREKDRALSWARTAAGNLAWMAKKDRGWQEAERSTMDAAVYALDSLNTPSVKDRKALEAIQKAAQKKVGAAPAPPAASRPKKPKPRSTNLAAFLGAKANARLARRHPVFEAKQRGDDDRLRTVLAARGYPAHAALFTFEARYGGLVFADGPGEEGDDWMVGAYACLSSDAHKEPRGGRASLVPVAYSPNDLIFYLDADGSAWAEDSIEDPAAAPYAPDGDAMMKRILTER